MALSSVAAIAFYEVGTQLFESFTGAPRHSSGTALGVTIYGVQFALAIPVQALLVYLLDRPYEENEASDAQ